MGLLRRSGIIAAVRRHVPHLLIASGLGCGAVTTLQAQDGSVGGLLVGTVQDSSGKPVSTLQLSLHPTDTLGDPSLPRTVRPAPDGTFILGALPPGSYILHIDRDLHPLLRQPVEVGPEDPVTLQIVLPASGAPALVVPPTEPAAPAPLPEPLPDENGDGLVTARGLEPQQNSHSVDGVSATQALGGVPVGAGSDPTPDPAGDPDSAEQTTGPANGMARGRHAGIAYTYSQGSVREFLVSGLGYSAASGRAGDRLEAFTRSGGERLHGSATFVLRSQLFAASNPLAIATSYSNGVVTSAEVKPHDLRENFGGTCGGPVPRAAHLFFFASVDAQLRGFPAISSPADPSFYSLTPTQTALLANRGVTPAATSTALNDLSSLTGPTPRRADQSIEFLRLDLRRFPRLAPSLEYNAVRWSSPAGLIDAPVVARGRASLGNSTGSADFLAARLHSALRASLVNELRAAFVRDLQFETPQPPLPQEPAISPGGLAPEVNIAPNGLLFGTPAALSQKAYPDEQRLQLGDTVSWIHGRHAVEAGAEWSHIHEQVATLANAAGTFLYDSGATNGKAGGLVDFITDTTFSVNASPNGACPSIYAATHLFCFRSYSQSFGVDSIAFATQDWSAFLEDTFRLRHGLTLHAGLRYEYTLLPFPTTPNPSLDALFGPRGATSVFPEDRNNFGPRASLAWEPFGPGHGLIRAGFGLFYGRLPGATIRSALSDTAETAATLRIRIAPSAIVACPQAPAQGFGFPCAFSALPSGVAASTTSAMVFDRRFRLPMVQQGSLSLERELGRASTLTATYVFNLDRQLPGSTDLNIAPSTSTGIFQLQGGTGAPGVRDGETFRLPLYSGRVSPAFGPVTDIVSDVNATYHGATLAARTRLPAGWLLRGNFTWSKAIDFGQNQSAVPRTDAQLDPFTLGYDKGLSALNYPYALRIDAAWSPALPGRLLHGWTLLPIVVARSGRPYTFDLSGGTSLPGGHLSLNGSGGALYLPTVGRNTLRLPAFATADLRAAREFQLRPDVRLGISAEAFNLLNHRFVTSVQQRAFLVGTASAGVTPLVFQSAAAIASEGLNVQPFGTPTSTGTSLNRERQLQFGARLTF